MIFKELGASLLGSDTVDTGPVNEQQRYSR